MPDTEIFLAPLTMKAGALDVGTPVNVSASPGYDNQPSFTPDGQSIVFTSARGGASAGSPSSTPQTDVFRYAITSKQVMRITSTPESEFLADADARRGAHLGDPRRGGWNATTVRFALNGTQAELVLPDIKPVGYHAWVDARTLVLFVLGKPPTLQVADVASGKALEMAADIGRSLQRMPNGRISFVQRRGGDSASLTVMELDAAARTAAPLVTVKAGATEADLAWTPDGILLMSHSDVLYSRRRGDSDWTRIVDLTSLGLKGVSRLAVNAAGDRIAFVVNN